MKLVESMFKTNDSIMEMTIRKKECARDIYLRKHFFVGNLLR